jgi:hypothetical protein
VRHAASLAAGLALVVSTAAAAQDGERSAVRAHAVLAPSAVGLGEVVSYRGSVVVPSGLGVRWLPPDSGGAFTWGERRAGRVPASDGGSDSVWVEAPLQAFAIGMIPVPGLRIELREGASDRPRYARLPTASLVVAPVVPADDSTADLRGLRGPLGAPWWERVPWLWVIAALIAIAAIVWLVRRLRRRKPAPAVAPAAPAPRRDPVAEALTELAALRRLALPAQGRYGEHAFHLSRILRRFLEATAHAPRPGDTTPELVQRLRDAWLEPADLERLEGLLVRWDRVKFARATSSPEDCAAAEAAVESWVRRFAAPSAKVA